MNLVEYLVDEEEKRSFFYKTKTSIQKVKDQLYRTKVMSYKKEFLWKLTNKKILWKNNIMNGLEIIRQKHYKYFFYRC